MQFDYVSKYYDSLSKAVFGGAIQEAKVSLYDEIPSGASVLFVGGGSGVSLAYLLSKEKKLKIDFVDASHNMVSLAKGRIGVQPNVSFYPTTIEQFGGSSYDVIITEFFFDLFDECEIVELIRILDNKLEPGGILIDTDFRSPSNVTNRIVLKLMYVFFRIIAKLETSKLVDTLSLFARNRFKVSKEIKTDSGFISSRLFVEH